MEKDGLERILEREKELTDAFSESFSRVVIGGAHLYGKRGIRGFLTNRIFIDDACILYPLHFYFQDIFTKP